MFLLELKQQNDKRLALQREKQKIMNVSSYCENHESFWLGYLTSFMKNTADTINKVQIEKLRESIGMIVSVSKEALIKQENVMEIMSTLIFLQERTDTIYREGFVVSKAVNFVNDAIAQLTLDNKFLDKRYFKKVQSSIRREIAQNQNLGLECSICCEQITLSQVCPVSCGHNLHKNCLVQHFKSLVEIKKFPIKCPEDECGKDISLDDLQEYIPKELLDKYYDFSLHEFVDKNNIVHWCPSPGCKGIFEIEEGLVQYTCPACTKAYCLACKTQAHPELTCEQNRSVNNLSQDDRNFVNFAKNAKFKQCPSCKFWVQKNHGCDHITCRCSYEFCFRCGAQYGNGDCTCDQNDSFYGSEGGQSWIGSEGSGQPEQEEVNFQ